MFEYGNSDDPTDDMMRLQKRDIWPSRYDGTRTNTNTNTTTQQHINHNDVLAPWRLIAISIMPAYHGVGDECPQKAPYK